jgi:hypothetical protein
MLAPSNTSSPDEISTLLRGEPGTIAGWVQRWRGRRFAWQVEQAFYVAVKFPLIILLTTFGNALINGMFAPLLGLNIPFRQSFSAIVMSFTIAAAILGAFSPLIAFMVWNAPGLASGNVTGATYDFILLANVTVIALAGTTGNLRLFQLLAQLGGSRTVALRVQFAWLVGNLFLGSQLSWILRPFIGSPGLPVEFLRPTAFHGNFFEAVFNSLRPIFQSN